MWMITKILSFISQLVFPYYCFICKKEVATQESICTSCLLTFRRSYDTPYPYITSIYSFKDPSIKKIIHAIKYFHRKDLIAPLSHALIDEIKKKDTEYVLVPVPMPKLRTYMRGYNHIEALANLIHTKTGLPIDVNLVLRNPNHSKKRQVMMKSRNERIKNPHNAFIVNSSASIHGKKIILLDDVTTTGATLQEIRKLLLQHGAKEVEAYTFAH